MAIHFILLYSIFILALLYRITRDKDKTIISKVLLIIIFLILILFIGMRDINIGTDTVTYVSMFFNQNYNYSSLEIIPLIISWIIRLFTNKYYIYLIIFSTICLFGIYESAKQYKFDTEYFLFLYITSFCYLYSTSAIKFFCAFSIIMYSFKYMINCETKKVIILVLLATLFHASSLIFIPVYFVTKFKFTKAKLLLLILILTLVVLLFNFIDISFILNFEIFNEYKYIIENQNSFGGLSVLMNIGILIFSLMYYNNISIYKKEYEFFIKMHIIATAVDFIGIAYRAVWFFRFPIWFILPIILKNIKNKKKDYIIIYLSFMLIYTLIYYQLIKSSLGTHNLLNYTFNIFFN